MGSAPRWSEDDKALLRDNTWMTNEDIGEKIGRSAFCVMKMRTKLKLPGAKRPDRKSWSEDERKFVTDHPELSLRQVAKHLGRTYSSVNNIRFQERVASGILPDPRKTGRPGEAVQELLKPPGTYVEIIGSLLFDEYPDVMEHWKHAHGYTIVAEKFRDPLGWVTVLCTVPEEKE